MSWPWSLQILSPLEPWLAQCEVVDRTGLDLEWSQCEVSTLSNETMWSSNKIDRQMFNLHFGIYLWYVDLKNIKHCCILRGKVSLYHWHGFVSSYSLFLACGLLSRSVFRCLLLMLLTSPPLSLWPIKLPKYPNLHIPKTTDDLPWIKESGWYLQMNINKQTFHPMQLKCLRIYTLLVLVCTCHILTDLGKSKYKGRRRRRGWTLKTWEWLSRLFDGNLHEAVATSSVETSERKEFKTWKGKNWKERIEGLKGL